MKIKAVVFDLDGTLWDASDSVVKAWNIVFARRGINKTMQREDLRACFGKTNNEIADMLFPSIPKAERNNILDECGIEEIKILKEQGGVLYPRVEETLRELKNKYKLMVVSNCQVGYIESFIDYFKFNDIFCDIESNGKTGLDKAGNIKLILERNNIKEAVYVGDTNIDYEATCKNKLPFIYTTYGFDKVDCKYKIDNFNDIIKTLEQIEKDL